MIRAKACSADVLSKYYDQLENILTKYNLMGSPHLIFNLDETGINTEHDPPPIVTAAKSTPQAITSPRTSTTTIITCVSATGQILPPFFIFKGKRYSSNLMSGALPGSGCDMSPSGWSNGQIFKKYVKEFFQKHIPNRQSDEYCLLIYDGHKSHVNHDLIEWALENKVVLFVLPAHTLLSH